MGEAFYRLLLEWSAQHVAANPDQVVAGALANIGMFIAYFWLTGSLLWLTRQSVLIRRTKLVYLLAAFIGLCGVGHLGHVVHYPDWLEMAVGIAGAVVSLFTAWVMWHSRHTILAMIFQFKYVLGLLRTMDAPEKIPGGPSS